MEAAVDDINCTKMHESNDAKLVCKLFKKFLDVTSDGFIAINKEGKIIEINESYCSLLKITREKALSSHVLELIPNTRMIHVLDNNITEVDVLDEHQVGVLKGKYLICSRSTIEENGEVVASFAHVRYPEKTTEVAGTFTEVLKKLEYYKSEYCRLVRDKYGFDKIISNHPSVLGLKNKALRASAHNFAVLLQGETGTGKELFAHAIHQASNRSQFPFIRVNCAAIPTELIESELFGYEEGAFSGARKGGKPGKIEMADRGTLFLDEVGDMPLSMQAKLLRVLQDKELEHLGGTKPKIIDVRIIAATNHNLEQRIRENLFREDLYFRLNVINLHLVPLRERPGDIGLLAQHFLGELNMQYETDKTLEKSFVDALKKYNWPGNGRELRNAIEHAFSFSEKNEILKDALPYKVLQQSNAKYCKKAEQIGLVSTMKEFENHLLKEVLEKYDGCYDKAADALKIHRTTLYKKMRYKA